MQEEIMVSVLCTAYNHESFIRDALEGFVSQKTDFAFEVLINDDCSTDSTADIIREYETKYPNIIRAFYQEKNLFSQGLNIYSEIFYSQVRGKYVAFCEGDDHWCDINKIQRQVNWLEAHPGYAACVHNSFVHDCSGKETDKLLLPKQADRDIPFETVVTGMSNSFHTSSILMKRELVINPPDFQLIAEQHKFSDYAIALWACLNGGIHFIERTMSVYNVSSNPMSWSSGIDGDYEKRRQFVTGEIKMLECLKKHVSGDKLAKTEETLREREFELLYITGKDKELIKEPYLAIYRRKPLSFRLKQWVKRNMPLVQKLHRQSHSYGD